MKTTLREEIEKILNKLEKVALIDDKGGWTLKKPTKEVDQFLSLFRTFIKENGVEEKSNQELKQEMRKIGMPGEFQHQVIRDNISYVEGAKAQQDKLLEKL